MRRIQNKKSKKNGGVDGKENTIGTISPPLKVLIPHSNSLYAKQARNTTRTYTVQQVLLCTTSSEYPLLSLETTPLV